MIEDIYEMARSLIPSDEVYLKKCLGNTENDVGQEIPSYADAVLIDGVFQAMESTLIDRLGLDIDRVYRILYSDTEVQDATIGASSDIIVFNGDEYQAIKRTDWLTYAGWNGVICVRL